MLRVRSAVIAMLGAVSVALIAAMPRVALAAEEVRALERTPDSGAAILYTVGAGVALMLVATVGCMYRRVRDLDWEFQHPDAPAHHDGH